MLRPAAPQQTLTAFFIILSHKFSTGRGFDFAYHCARMLLTLSGERVPCLQVLQRESFEKRNSPA
jgi:molybdenum cofactor biosynthesis enzyme MoaA